MTGTTTRQVKAWVDMPGRFPIEPPPLTKIVFGDGKERHLPEAILRQCKLLLLSGNKVIHVTLTTDRWIPLIVFLKSQLGKQPLPLLTAPLQLHDDAYGREMVYYYCYLKMYKDQLETILRDAEYLGIDALVALIRHKILVPDAWFQK